MKIPTYYLKIVEEIVRGVAVAVGGALIAAIYAQGVPTTRQALAGILVGLLPVAYAALRAAITKATMPQAPVAALPPSKPTKP